MPSAIWSLPLLTPLYPLLANALSLDVTSSASIKNASDIVAKDMLSFYHGTDPGQVPGIFGEPYHWEEAGAVWGSLIDYWNYTGDTQYVSLVQQALLWQVGSGKDYMPKNQSKPEANDDQAIWALAAMRAAELRFPNPSTSPSWHDLAVNVFNDQASRWDTQTCGGGLRWQIFPSNPGYDYKNTMSNGAFFQLAARLARYTGNQTYADWATKSYDWTRSVGFINDDHKVFDGAKVGGNCSALSRIQWTSTAGAFMYGSAVMSKLSNTNTTWETRTNKLLSAMSVFFTTDKDTDDNIAKPASMFEAACEPAATCTIDVSYYKGLTAQWMGETMQVAPFTKDTILSYLQSSATGAAQQCSGGPNGTTCGMDWTTSEYGGKKGLGREFDAFSVILANLALNSSAPISENTTIASQTDAATKAANGSPSSSSTTNTSGRPTASTSISRKPSSGSERLWAVKWTLSLVMPAAMLSLLLL